MLNKKVDILIGVPSYNEADSISSIVSTIDRGLTRDFSTLKSLIVNIDSNSDDNTVGVFLNTKTKTQKDSIVVKSQQRGKGKNLIEFFKLAQKLEAKYVCTFDGDLTSLESEWPAKMIKPLMYGRLDFVLPIYTRNKFEATITNHFCYPLVTAWFCREVRQPIAGDFAMNKKFVDHILKVPVPHSAHFYGVDIFLTVNALGGGFSVGDVCLGRKIHKASFGKLFTMFSQVATSTIFALQNNKQECRCFPGGCQGYLSEAPVCVDKIYKKPQDKEIANLKQQAFNILKDQPQDRLKKYLGLLPENVKLILEQERVVDARFWIQILKSVLNFAYKKKPNENEAEKIAELLLPFFILRVISYFDEVSDRPNEVADAIVRAQVDRLMDSLG